MLDQLDVLRGADKRYGDCIHVTLQREFKIALVLLRQRGHAYRDPRQIDPLILAKHTSIDHFADHIGILDLAHPQFNQTIREQEARALLEVLRQCLEGGANKVRCSNYVSRGDHQHLPRPQQDGDFVLESPGADLWTLKIAHDADPLALLHGHRADHLDQFQLLGVCSMREVETGHIKARTHQLAEHRFAVGSWTKCCNNLGSSLTLSSTQARIGKERIHQSPKTMLSVGFSI